MLDTILRLLHPTMPYVTETLWTALTDGVDGQKESLVVSAWPDASMTTNGADVDPVAQRRVEDLIKLVTEIRRFRSDQGVKPSQRVPARVDCSAADLQAQEPAIRNLARIDEPSEGFSATASIELRLSQTTITVELDTSDTVDKDAERKRMEKDLKAANKELETTGKKLANENFLTKAPDAVVNKIRERRAIAEEEVARISARLADLG